MTDLQKIRERLHKEMEVLVDRTVDELTEETTPPARVPGDGQGPHEPVTPQRVEALLGEISAAYSRLGATKRKLSEAEGAVRNHEQRLRVEKRQLLTNAKNERVAGLLMDEALDTDPYRKVLKNKESAELDHFEARAEVDRLQLSVKLLRVGMAPGVAPDEGRDDR